MTTNIETPIPDTERAPRLRPPKNHLLVCPLVEKRTAGGLHIPDTVDASKVRHDTGHSIDVKDNTERFLVLEVAGNLPGPLQPGDVVHCYRKQVRPIGDYQGNRDAGIVAWADCWAVEPLAVTR